MCHIRSLYNNNTGKDTPKGISWIKIIEIKILICGDSITKGVTFDESKKRYINLENSFIKTIASKINMQIDNVSKFGNTVSKAMRSFKMAIEKMNTNI